MNPFDLTVYTSPFQKIRIGKDFDGGYIVCDIPNVNYDILIAGGVADDITFEEHLSTIYPNINCLAFDGTPYCKINTSNVTNITFIQKNIGTHNDSANTNLFDIIEQYDNIFLKMDIEGAELPWLNCLSEEQQNKFSQIVMEFHFPFSEEDKNIFRNLNKTHLLVHLHGNNCPAGVFNHRGVIIPNVFECTYINKKYVDLSKIEVNKSPLPSNIDMPNCGGTDIDLNYPPFVNI